MTGYDHLTDSPKHLVFFEQVNHDLDQAVRDQNRLAILHLHIVGATQPSHTAGNEAAGILLQIVADRLRNCLGDMARVIHLGDDKFGIILTGIRMYSDVKAEAEKIIHSLNRPFSISGQSLNIGVSIGAALYPKHGDNSKALIKRASEAMSQ